MFAPMMRTRVAIPGPASCATSTGASKEASVEASTSIGGTAESTAALLSAAPASRTFAVDGVDGLHWKEMPAKARRHAMPERRRIIVLGRYLSGVRFT